MTCTRRILSVWCIEFLCLIVLTTGCNTLRSNESGQQMNTPAPQGNRVRLEHVALNVSDPVQMAQWYVEHLNMRILREGPPPINGRFLADNAGNYTATIAVNFGP